MKKFFKNFNKILITIIFLISCSEETILYDEIENREGTIKTASLPLTNNKLYQSFPSFSSNSKLHFGNVKDSENLFSLVQMTLFSGNIPPVSLVDLLADSIQVDSAMVFFQTTDSLQTDFTLGLYSIVADDDSVFSDSLNYFTKDNFIDFENNSMLLNTLNLSSEIVAPDTTGFDSIKFMFEADSGSLDLLKEYLNEMETNPARGPLSMWRAIWKRGWTPYVLPFQWCVCDMSVGINDVICFNYYFSNLLSIVDEIHFFG